MANLSTLQNRLAAVEQESIAKLQTANEEAARREKQLKEENKRIDDAYKADLERLTRATETLRIEKDETIRRLTASTEQMRAEYEARISKLEASLQKFHQVTVKLEGNVLELNTRLAGKEDVERQRDAIQAHHDSMQASK